jgi:hypothetical protein
VPPRDRYLEIQFAMKTHKPFDEGAFVPYRFTRFMSRTEGPAKTRAHTMRPFRKRINWNGVPRLVDNLRATRRPVVARQ